MALVHSGCCVTFTPSISGFFISQSCPHWMPPPHCLPLPGPGNHHPDCVWRGLLQPSCERYHAALPFCDWLTALTFVPWDSFVLQRPSLFKLCDAHCRSAAHFVHSLILWWTLGLLPPVDGCGYCCYEGGRTKTYWRPCFPFFCACSEGQLLDHMIILCLMFWEIILFSIEAKQFLFLLI